MIEECHLHNAQSHQAAKAHFGFPFYLNIPQEQDWVSSKRKIRNNRYYFERSLTSARDHVGALGGEQKYPKLTRLGKDDAFYLAFGKAFTINATIPYCSDWLTLDNPEDSKDHVRQD